MTDKTKSTIIDELMERMMFYDNYAVYGGVETSVLQYNIQLAIREINTIK